MDNLLYHPGLIASFGVLVLIMLALDLGVFNKKSHVISSKEAMWWSIAWIGLSMAFSGAIYQFAGFEKFTQYQSAYWIEKALSVDNLFVFILVFSFFRVPREVQHKVLFWGILGALFFRAIFIFAGVALIEATYLNKILNYFGREGFKYDINIVLFIFGIFLLYAGIKSWGGGGHDDEDKDYSQSPGARLIHRFFKVSKNFDGDKFFTVQNGVKMATPLLVVVTVIEFSDLLFAVDSIPAIFAIAPDDPFILYTSNIFAILGLRSLYFLLANFMYMFSRLSYGLAIILAFIGFKMVIGPFYHIESSHSLMVVVGVLIGSVLASIWFPVKTEPKD
ncbi:tellurite resistance protein TerC [Arcticibacter pallidicorallinus]|uniref:Tellurite resistance protein TerC n=1 Tax=Arcticibacter pallidicorallinus TaxID=1259464 RepID=A0A2T0U594_9SPHI|nr:TerC family protein [Arcticibacter pallidicorallinus]PRY53062.1 tellurite resistance protein TerC [Arcticibacter pallidicorallinus]